MDKQEEAIRFYESLIDGYHATYGDDYPCDHPYCLAVEALREKQQRDGGGEQQPLTVEELRQMDRGAIFTKTIGVIGSGRWELMSFDEHWVYFKTVYEDYKVTYREFEDSYGKTWLAYRTKPTED